MSKQDERCETCRFWRIAAPIEGMIGFCRRFPPQKFYGDMDFAVHTLSPDDDWCGEWRPITEATAQRTGQR